MTKEQLKQLEKDLWDAADSLRANSDLRSSEYSTPVLGLIFLRFADNKYRQHEKEILAEYANLKGTRREKPISDIAIEKCGFYPPNSTRLFPQSSTKLSKASSNHCMISRFIVIALVLASGRLSAESPGQWGSYPNRPLALQDLIPPDGRRFSLLHDFNYLDQTGRVWEAPTGLITDGASIPMPFWSVIGGPFEGLYREAAVVHDAGCCAQMKPWKDVHRMFYNAMRCSGVGWVKAKTMFWAVWVGGPRWTHLNPSMPAECKIAQPSGRSQALSSWKTLHTNVASGVLQQINQRQLSLPEARAVARPFFTRGPMSDADALEFVAKLKERTITPADQQVILLSVLQSELISDEDVKRAEQWIEKENPPLEAIEARAEEMRNKKVTALRLFPEVKMLKESLEDFRLEAP